jgi:hypothetical protein
MLLVMLLQVIPVQFEQAEEKLDAFQAPFVNVAKTGLDCKKSCKNASSDGPSESTKFAMRRKAMPSPKIACGINMPRILSGTHRNQQTMQCNKAARHRPAASAKSDTRKKKKKKKKKRKKPQKIFFKNMKTKTSTKSIEKNESHHQRMNTLSIYNTVSL